MNQKATIPVGVELLGRVINSSGTPLDSQGPITAQQAPVVELSALAGRQQPERAQQMLEMGIKLIDLLAPIPRGGAIAFFGGAGLGKQVVTQEVMQHLMTHDNGYAVLVDVSEDTYETTGLAEIINELGLREKSVFVYEQQQATSQLYRQALQAALTIGEHFRKQRHEVLLIAEDYVAKQAGSSDLQRSAQALGITTLLLGPVEGIFSRRKISPSTAWMAGSYSVATSRGRIYGPPLIACSRLLVCRRATPWERSINRLRSRCGNCCDARRICKASRSSRPPMSRQ